MEDTNKNENQEKKVFEAFDDLLNDFYDMRDKYQNLMNIPQFLASLLMFTSKSIFETAPTRAEAHELIFDAVMNGLDWNEAAKEEIGKINKKKIGE